MDLRCNNLSNLKQLHIELTISKQMHIKKQGGTSLQLTIHRAYTNVIYKKKIGGGGETTPRKNSNSITDCNHGFNIYKME